MWSNREELLYIRNYPTLDPKAKPFLQPVLDKLLKEMDTPPYIEAMDTHPEVWHQIGVAGYLCLSDYTSEAAYGPEQGEFLTAMPALSDLSQIIDKIPEKYRTVFLNIKNNGGRRLEEVIKSSDASCIHGIGMMLLHYYFKMYRGILDYYQKDASKTKQWKDWVMGGIHDTGINVKGQSHKVFLFTEEYRGDTVLLDRDNSITMVNNMPRKRDANGNNNLVIPVQS